MPTIFIRDELRAATEAATGELGQRALHRPRPADLHALDSKVHVGRHRCFARQWRAPGFIVDGIERDGIWIGMYPGVVKNGELLRPARRPSDHIATIHLLRQRRACVRRRLPRHDQRRVGGSGLAHRQERPAAASATPTGVARTTPPGRPPVAWMRARLAAPLAPDARSPALSCHLAARRHACRDRRPGGQHLGIHPRPAPGRWRNQVLANNDAATASLFDDSAPWKAILKDGSLVAPGTAGTLTSASINDTTAPAIMRALALAPRAAPALAGGLLGGQQRQALSVPRRRLGLRRDRRSRRALLVRSGVEREQHRCPPREM